jgi:D-alanyl-D-alanine carboxypeptidase (penicillin-binding protein 5/6)
VAEHVAGSEAAFVERMNAQARALGMTDTNFINASGLTNSSRHHASPRDLAVLAHEAMSDDDFAAIAGTVRADIPGLGSLHTRNLLLRRYEGATGVKTGYMASAGLCLVASATRDGRDLYAVVLDSDDSFGDTAAVLDLGYDAFTVVAVDGAVPAVYRTAWGVVDLQRPDAAPHTVAVADDVRVRTSLVPVPPGNTTSGTVLGRAELLVDGEVVDRSPLRAAGPLPGAPAATPSTAAGAAVQEAIRAFVRVRPQRRPVPEGGERIVRQAGRS